MTPPLLTKLSSSSAETIKLEDGRTYRITRLTSEAVIREHYEDQKERRVLKKAKAKAELTKEQKNRLNTAKKLELMPESARARKLRSIIFERKKTQLREDLKLGCLRQKHLQTIQVTSEEIAAEEQIYLATLAWFNRETRG